MNVIKSMKIMNILEDTIILKDRADYMYVIVDKEDVEWVKSNRHFKYVLAINYKNKTERYAKVLIDGIYIKDWVNKYLNNEITDIETAYRLFIPLVYKYRPLRQWLKEKYGKDIFRKLGKKDLVDKVSEFISERYCSKGVKNEQN